MGLTAEPFWVWQATQYEIAGKTCFPGVEICEGFMADSSFDSSISRPSSDVVDFFFLLSSFEVLIAEKKKQTSLSFDNSKSHSSRFSQIQFQACWISSSLTLQTHLNATTEHVFSIAATMWHSTLSLITLLFSCEQGLLILTGQRSRVKSDFSRLLSHSISSTILTGIEQVCAIGWISWLKVRA